MSGEIFRFLPPFKGKQRLARFFLRNQMKRIKDVEVSAKYGCRYLLPNIIENVGFDIYTDGVFEDDTVHFIIKRLAPDAVWLDIGANIGSISIPVCKRRPDVKAICIEASPRVYSYLKHNVKLNSMQNMELVNLAVSDTDGQQLNFYSPVEKFGKGSLSSVFTSDAEQVKGITLDTLVEQSGSPRIDFIKVDVEGFEYTVFKGGSRLLSDPASPDILFEFIDWAEKASGIANPGDAQQILLDYGYTLYRFGHAGNLDPHHAVQRKGYNLILASKRK